MSFRVVCFYDLQTKRATTSHIARDSGWTVCGRIFSGNIVPQQKALFDVGCKTCKKWITKNAKRIATGDLK